MKVFSYDEPAYFDATDFSVVQHDSTNYGTGFVAGRGNLTTVNEYDPQTGSWRMPTRTKYDKTGMITAVTDAANNTTQIFYEDNFLSGQGVGQTHALLTRVKDPDGFWGGRKYDWYTGNVKESYHIAGTSETGAHENVTTYGYDAFDRLIVTQPNGGTTTTTYWDNWLAAEPIRRSTRQNALRCRLLRWSGVRRRRRPRGWRKREISDREDRIRQRRTGDQIDAPNGNRWGLESSRR